MTADRLATSGAAIEASLAEAIIRLVLDAGLCDDGSALTLTGIAEGVSSEHVRVTHDDGRRWLARRPLARLRTEREWQAPQRRAGTEAAWLQWAREITPDFVPTLLAVDADAHVLLLADPAADAGTRWGDALRSGHLDPSVTRLLGQRLGTLHAEAAGDDELAERFQDDGLFHTLRLRPLLHAAIEAHADLKVELRACEADLLGTAERTLINGDPHPDRIRVAEGGTPVLMSGEFATWAPAHFDAASVLTHLLTAWAMAPDEAKGWRVLARTFEAAWCEALAPPSAERQRAVLLIPALLLAAVDGLAPAPGIAPEPRARIRSFARTQLRTRPTRLDLLLERYERAMGDID